MNKPTASPKKKYTKPDLYRTVRLWPKTVNKLKQIAAMRGKTMVEMLDAWSTEELSKRVVENKENRHD